MVPRSIALRDCRVANRHSPAATRHLARLPAGCPRHRPIAPGTGARPVHETYRAPREAGEIRSVVVGLNRSPAPYQNKSKLRIKPLWMIVSPDNWRQRIQRGLCSNPTRGENGSLRTPTADFLDARCRRFGTRERWTLATHRFLLQSQLEQFLRMWQAICVRFTPPCQPAAASVIAPLAEFAAKTASFRSEEYCRQFAGHQPDIARTSYLPSNRRRPAKRSACQSAWRKHRE
jgi:hypothetical protein